MIYLPEKLITTLETQHIFEICPAVISISSKCIIMKILKYSVCWYTFPLTKATPLTFERVSTYCQTLKKCIDHNAARYHTFFLSLTWIDHNATCYHNFNVLPHKLLYIFSQCGMTWGYLQRVTVKFIRKYRYFLIRMMAKHGNAVQIAQKRGQS